jgi:transposase
LPNRRLRTRKNEAANNLSKSATGKKRRNDRGALPAHLARVHVTIEPESTTCPCCNGQMHLIGDETSERPHSRIQHEVIVTHRPKYACRDCEGAVVQAPAPERLIKNGIPTEGMVASVAGDKFARRKPLYRQAQILALRGLPLDARRLGRHRRG